MKRPPNPHPNTLFRNLQLLTWDSSRLFTAFKNAALISAPVFSKNQEGTSLSAARGSTTRVFRGRAGPWGLSARVGAALGAAGAAALADAGLAVCCATSQRAP